MDMTGERRIEAPRQAVWLALNDPAVLKASIPRLRKPGQAVGQRHEGDGVGEDRADLGAVQRRGPPVGHRPAQRLHDSAARARAGVAGFAKGGAQRCGWSRRAAPPPYCIMRSTRRSAARSRSWRQADRTPPPSRWRTHSSTGSCKQVTAAAAPPPVPVMASPVAAPMQGTHAAPLPPTISSVAPMPPTPLPPSSVSLFALIPPEAVRPAGRGLDRRGPSMSCCCSWSSEACCSGRPACDVADTARLLADQGYIADQELATTVHLSLAMHRPLFLEGEPGTGKTVIAKVLAAGLGRPAGAPAML